MQVGLNPKSPILGQAVHKPVSKFEGNFHRNNAHRNTYFLSLLIKFCFCKMADSKGIFGLSQSPLVRNFTR